MKLSLYTHWDGIGIATTTRVYKVAKKFGNLLHYWWSCKLVQLLWKTVWQFPPKLKIEFLYDPAIILLGKYPKELKARSRSDICTPMFMAILFTIAKIRTQPNCPSIDEFLISKMWYIHIGDTYTYRYIHISKMWYIHIGEYH